MYQGINIGYNNYEIQNIFKNLELLHKSEGPYYHYTSLANCLNILKLTTDKNTNLKNGIELYASHFLYLNDKEEFLNGLEKLLVVMTSQFSKYKNKSEITGVLNDYLIKYNNIKSSSDSLISSLPNHYILSFCKSGNLLGQWKYYGKDSGVAIEFDLNNCFYIGDKTQSNQKPYSCCEPYDIIYDEKEQTKIFKDLYSARQKEAYTMSCIAKKSLMVASYMKHYAFSEEKESRLLIPLVYFPPQETSNNLLSLINYRESSGIVKPYIKVKIFNKSKSKTPIKSVTIGPGINQEQVFNAIVLLIKTRFPNGKTNLTIQNNKAECCDYITVNGIIIKKSNYPFRNQ